MLPDIEKSPKNSSLGKIAKLPSTSKDDRKRLYRLQDFAAKLLPNNKVSQCHRSPVPGLEPRVSLGENGKAYYKNLIICSRVWECPCCSVRIGSVRRDELSVALVRARQLALTPLLVTFTIQHHLFDACKDNIAALQEAYTWAFSGRWFKNIREEYGWTGSIRNLEVTYGKNGWHTHSHMLLFIDLAGLTSTAEVAAESLQKKLSVRWKEALQQFGYDASLAHGVDVRTADEDIAEYVSKWGREPAGWWGAADELGRTVSKKAARDGITPFGLLEAYATTDEVEFISRYSGLLKSRIQAGKLFREYVEAFKYRHQLQWSRGLRDLLKMPEEQLDQELPTEEVPEAIDVMGIPGEVWRWVVDHQLRFEVLQSAAGGCAALLSWFEQHGIRITIYDLNVLAGGGL